MAPDTTIPRNPMEGSKKAKKAKDRISIALNWNAEVSLSIHSLDCWKGDSLYSMTGYIEEQKRMSYMIIETENMFAECI
jgi:hypothetical protein